MAHSAAAFHRRVTEALRQERFDFNPEPTPPLCQIPPRLLILACSGTKRPGEGLSARERYDGPLWQTLRSVDPDGRLAMVCFLSAKYGLGDARRPLRDYNSVLTAASSAAMIAMGPFEPYPFLPLEKMGDAARARARAAAGQRASAYGVLSDLAREQQRPFREIAVCGGAKYVAVATAWLSQLEECRWLGADAPTTIINNQIGYMRRDLGAWLRAGQPE